jgi:hypothetical protein
MLIRPVIQPMIDKYNKYWRDIPLLYPFAFILDPRAKMRGFAKVLRRLMNLTSTDYNAYQVGTRARLTDVYNKYEEKFGDVRLRRTIAQNLSGKKGLLGMKSMMMIPVPLVGAVHCSILVLICLEIHLLLLCCMVLLLQQLLVLLNLSHTWTVTLLTSCMMSLTS